MISGISVILAGFVLGIQHAFDPDHVVAISNIVGRHRSILRSSFIGISWGLGHTVILLFASVLLLLFKISIPEKIALFFEFFVGLLLIALGALAISDASKSRIHSDYHSHGKLSHLHLHEKDNHIHIDKRPFIVGMLHGFAGSAALMLLVLGAVNTVAEGFMYVAFFGLGSIVGMLIATAIISLPFIFTSGRISGINVAIRMTAGLIGIAFGIFIIYSVGSSILF